MSAKNLLNNQFLVLLLLFAAVLTYGQLATRHATAAPATQQRTLVVHGSINDGPAIHTLVLGDSYSSGNAANDPNQLYYRVAPDDPNQAKAKAGSFWIANWCYRSANSYSKIYHDMTGSVGAYVNRACSGSVNADLPSQYADLVEDGFGSQFHQVMLSIGGNDANFSDIAKNCIIEATSLWTQCRKSLDFANEKLITIENEIVVSLRNIQSKFPNATIFLVGYPQIYEGKRKVPFISNCKTCTYKDPSDIDVSDALAKITEKANELQSRIARQFPDRVMYLPVSPLFKGHGAGTADPYIKNAFTSLSWMEWIHPTKKGHALIAEALFNLKVYEKIAVHLLPTRTLTKIGKQWFAYDENRVLRRVASSSNLEVCAQEIGYAVNRWPQSLIAKANLLAYDNLLYMECRGNGLHTGDLLQTQTSDLWMIDEQIEPNVTYVSSPYLFPDASGMYLPLQGTLTKRQIVTDWMKSCFSSNRLIPNVGEALLSRVPGDVVYQNHTCTPASMRQKLLEQGSRLFFVDGHGYAHPVLDSAKACLKEKFQVITATENDIASLEIKERMSACVQTSGAHSLVYEDLEGFAANNGRAWYLNGDQRQLVTTNGVKLCALFNLKAPQTDYSATEGNLAPYRVVEPLSCVLDNQLLHVYPGNPSGLLPYWLLAQHGVLNPIEENLLGCFPNATIRESIGPVNIAGILIGPNITRCYP
jgi:GDSL-like Lipase/Acylhydrolase family